MQAGGGDAIFAEDATADVVNCGSGEDLAEIDDGLDVTTDCEELR